jgi:hypothetical protein
MDLDFLAKLAGMGGGGDLDSAATKRFGDAYGKAGKLKKAGMRLASMPQGEEDDLEFSAPLKPRMPTGMDPRRMYGDLYSSYGGRKMRGLLFD